MRREEEKCIYSHLRHLREAMFDKSYRSCACNPRKTLKGMQRLSSVSLSRSWLCIYHNSIHNKFIGDHPRQRQGVLDMHKI